MWITKIVYLSVGARVSVCDHFVSFLKLMQFLIYCWPDFGYEWIHYMSNKYYEQIKYLILLSM